VRVIVFRVVFTVGGIERVADEEQLVNTICEHDWHVNHETQNQFATQTAWTNMHSHLGLGYRSDFRLCNELVNLEGMHSDTTGMHTDTNDLHARSNAHEHIIRNISFRSSLKSLGSQAPATRTQLIHIIQVVNPRRCSAPTVWRLMSKLDGQAMERVKTCFAHIQKTQTLHKHASLANLLRKNIR
jgi:hypothetical protein